jgi:hypothetical protein
MRYFLFFLMLSTAFANFEEDVDLKPVNNPRFKEWA